MLIQIYVKNEPLEACDILIAKDDAVMSIPVAGIPDLQERAMDVKLVKPGENMAMKAAVFVAEAIKAAEAVASPVYIACPDKNIMDGICSMEYVGPAGGPIKCAAQGTKPQAPPRVRNKAKPKGDGQAAKGASDTPGAATGAGQKEPEKPDGAEQPGSDKPADTPPAPAADQKPGANGDDVGSLMQDPSFTKDGEVVLDGPAEKHRPEDPVAANTPRIMGLLKETGIPSGQIPGVLEALREAMDPEITLPMQVKLKLAKDGATGDMDPKETSKRVAPKFEELKKLLNEIDAANAAKS